MKNCLIYLSDLSTPILENDITAYLNKSDLDIEIIEDHTHFSEFEKSINHNDISLLICNLTVSFFNHQILSEFKQAFILWIHPDSYSKDDDDNYIRAFKTEEDALQFLRTAFENTAPPDFSQRVKASLGNKKKPTIKTQIRPEKKEESKPSVPGPAVVENYTDDSVTTAEEPDRGGEIDFISRSRKLQKQIFMKQQWEEHKMVGVWSPIHSSGVTTFTINYALFLANNRIYTTVMEGLTENQILKDILQQYTLIPENWESYAKAIHSDEINKEIDWTYKNVKFLPLDHDDFKIEWNPKSIEAYMTTPNVVDLTLVDLPTGKMEQYTRDSLAYLSELWILLEDNPLKVMAWKDYILQLKEKLDIPIHLILNKSFSFSKVKIYTDHLNVPLLVQLPAIHEECQKNMHENTPLYYSVSVNTLLDPPFMQLTRHLLGEDFKFINKKPHRWRLNIFKTLKD